MRVLGEELRYLNGHFEARELLRNGHCELTPLSRNHVRQLTGKWSVAQVNCANSSKLSKQPRKRMAFCGTERGMWAGK